MRIFAFLRSLIYLTVFTVSLVNLQVLNAQTVNATVKVQISRLQEQDKQLLAGMAQQLEEYINSYQWSDDNQDIVIPCQINFIIETVTNRGSDRVFRTQFLISSPSGENFYDKNGEFIYQRGQSMSHQRAIYDPLLQLVDYYIYMVIAGELDTYILLGGTPFYNQALQIANQGMVSIYPSGWRARLEEVKLITDGDHVPLRQAKYYYYEGLYYIEAEPNVEEARKLAKTVVDLLEQVYQKRPNSKALKRFFDAHYQEFCSLFKYDEDKFNVRRLIRIDDRHRESYEKCLK